MNVITSTIAREWFAEIVSGSKRIEYREIKPYWTKRLKAVRVPFKLVLRNGMSPPIPIVTVRIDRVTPLRSGANRGSYALQIGRVLRVEHWNRKTQRPQ